MWDTDAVRYDGYDYDDGAVCGCLLSDYADSDEYGGGGLVRRGAGWVVRRGWRLLRLVLAREKR